MGVLKTDGMYIDPWQDKIKPNVPVDSADRRMSGIDGPLRGRTGINLVEGNMLPDEVRPVAPETTYPGDNAADGWRYAATADAVPRVRRI